MPDLSLDASRQYWFGYKDQSIFRVLSFMESVENWTMDGDVSFDESLKKLADSLDNIGNIDLQKEDSMIKVAFYLKATQMLRLLQALDTTAPGAASKLLMYSEKSSTSPNDMSGLFLRRNVVFERLRLLGRVLSEQRFSLVSDALGGAA